VAAASLSNRYITGRQLPDKAIDLIDEASSAPAHGDRLQPEEIDELRRKVDRMKWRSSQLKKETEDAASKERLAKLRAENCR
jgi:ATP-dependent Clp protease ATP-binding subunit ClpB